jgi:hypothetical protein
MDAQVLIALIGLPSGVLLAAANLLIARATYLKAKSTDRAVNHRPGNGTTLSQDMLDVKAEQREMKRDFIFHKREVKDDFAEVKHDLREMKDALRSHFKECNGRKSVSDRPGDADDAGG